MNKVENVYNTIEDFMNYYDSLELGKGIRKNFSRVHFYAGVMQLCITLKNDEDLNLMHALFINYSKTCYYFQICKLYERTKYNMELIEKVEQHIQKIGIAIRELALSEELEVNNKFDWRVFNSRYRRFMYLSYKSLNHKFDKRGKITFKIDYEEEIQLKELRKEYYKVNFYDDAIFFYDCILEKIVTIEDKWDFRKLMYMAYCTHLNLYTSTMLWIRQDIESSMNMEESVPYQLLCGHEDLLRRFFGKMT